MLRVLVVDDHPLFLQGIRSVLTEIDAGIEVVGAASTGAEAVDLGLSLRPDVVLLDLNLADLDGIEVTRRLLAGGCPVAVLILTMYDDDSALAAALAAGARGYLLKGSTAAEVLSAIRTVAAGGVVFGQAVAEKVLTGLRRPREAVSVPGLSAREVEILGLVAQGLGNGAIARRLFLSEKTVRNHASAIYGKLGVRDRAEATEIARAAGLLDGPRDALPWLTS